MSASRVAMRRATHAGSHANINIGWIPPTPETAFMGMLPATPEYHDPNFLRSISSMPVNSPFDLSGGDPDTTATLERLRDQRARTDQRSELQIQRALSSSLQAASDHGSRARHARHRRSMSTAAGGVEAAQQWWTGYPVSADTFAALSEAASGGFGGKLKVPRIFAKSMRGVSFTWEYLAKDNVHILVPDSFEAAAVVVFGPPRSLVQQLSNTGADLSSVVVPSGSVTVRSTTGRHVQIDQKYAQHALTVLNDIRGHVPRGAMCAFCGHGIGGGVAIAAAVLGAGSGFCLDVDLITFGAPPVGNGAFSRAAHALIPMQLHVVLDTDPVVNRFADEGRAPMPGRITIGGVMAGCMPSGGGRASPKTYRKAMRRDKMLSWSGDTDASGSEFE
ncbi:unnamed protein product [Pedinophyceae sp. YPF-701]|nr:unnamed protein product [Pedinophyceae sp. YPF-701]